MGNSSTSKNRPRRRPGLTPEARENQIIADAMDMAEEQIRDRTASSQVLTHFLKLATTKMELEKEKLRNENELLRAKTEAIQSAQHTEELYKNAIKAMQRYSGQGASEEDEY